MIRKQAGMRKVQVMRKESTCILAVCGLMAMPAAADTIELTIERGNNRGALA